MKKMTILNLIFLLATVFNYSQAAGSEDPISVPMTGHVSTLIINANVNVILVGNEKAGLQVVGNKKLANTLIIEKSGDTLRINSHKRKNLKDAGVIYIPASRLQKIQINGEANVESLYALRVPKLDVVINAVCKFSVANIGEVNVIETEKYTVDHSTEVRRLPRGVTPYLR
jgi:hypothetical protein